MSIPCPHCKKDNLSSARFCPFCGASLQGSNDPLLNQIVGKFRLEEKIGSGGFGSVYRARHVDLGRLYAVKVLLPHLAHQTPMIERFRREARVLAELRHENIVEIADFGSAPEIGFYLTMEWLDGQTLRSFLADKSIRPKPEVLYLFAQILDALHTAHERGIVHRDLKPENVMLTVGGFGRTVVKLLDFGIALFEESNSEKKRLTLEGSTMGTPQYMAPEQLTGALDKISPQTDLYTCGILFARLLTGVLPFSTEEIHELLYRQTIVSPPLLRELEPALSFSPALEALFAKALAKEPKDRFENAHQMLDALEKAFAEEECFLLPRLSLPLSLPASPGPSVSLASLFKPPSSSASLFRPPASLSVSVAKPPASLFKSPSSSASLLNLPEPSSASDLSAQVASQTPPGLYTAFPDAPRTEEMAKPFFSFEEEDSTALENTASSRLPEIGHTARTKLSEIEDTASTKLSEIEDTAHAPLPEFEDTDSTKLPEIEDTAQTKLSDIEDTDQTKRPDLEDTARAKLPEFEDTEHTKLAALQSKATEKNVPPPLPEEGLEGKESPFSSLPTMPLTEAIREEAEYLRALGHEPSRLHSSAAWISPPLGASSSLKNSPASKPSPPTPFEGPTSRTSSRRAFWLAFGFALLLLVGLVVFLWLFLTAPE